MFCNEGVSPSHSPGPTAGEVPAGLTGRMPVPLKCPCHFSWPLAGDDANFRIEPSHQRQDVRAIQEVGDGGIDSVVGANDQPVVRNRLHAEVGLEQPPGQRQSGYTNIVSRIIRCASSWPCSIALFLNLLKFESVRTDM